MNEELDLLEAAVWNMGLPKRIAVKEFQRILGCSEAEAKERFNAVRKRAVEADRLGQEFLAILHAKGKTSKEAKAFLKAHKGKDPRLDKLLEYTMKKLIICK